MEKIWIDEYKKTGIPEVVELPSENTSLIDIFERNFQKYGSRDAFIFMDKTISYADVDRESKKFACYLQSLGLAKAALRLTASLQNEIPNVCRNVANLSKLESQPPKLPKR